ncbi:MAG: hypothetical protein ACM3MH_10760 [Actinomycetota bacterium]
MLKMLAILILPVALAGCAVGHLSLPMGPMTLGPSDDGPKPSCLTYGNTPAYGCRSQGSGSNAPAN